MKTTLENSFAIVDGMVVLLMAFVTVYVVFGFFHPDPRLVNLATSPIVLIVLWGLRVGTLILGAVFIYFYYGLRGGRVPVQSALLFAAVLLVCALLAFPAAVYYYEKTFDRNIAQFHPYLQLMPPTYRETPSNSALPRFTILCVGGSTTEFPNSKGRDWPALLQDRLRNTLLERDIQVSNLGRRWYTTLHTLINYQTNLRQHKPDLILVTHGINDLLHNADFSYLSIGPFREDYGHFVGPLHRLIKQRSIFQRARSVLDLVWYVPEREVVETHDFPGLTTFKRNLIALVRLAQSDDTKVVLVTQPYLYKDTLTDSEKAALEMVNREAVGHTKRWSYGTAKSGMEQYTSCVRQLAQETGSQLIDLEKAIPKELDYFYDDVHYTDKSFDLICDTLASRLIELGVFGGQFSERVIPRPRPCELAGVDLRR
jgi:hypothetical protein